MHFVKCSKLFQSSLPCFDFRRNILDTQDKDYLSSCRYNAHDEQDRFCPIFKLGDIVKIAGEDYDSLAFYVSMGTLLLRGC